MKCIAEKVLHASAVDERDDLDGWHVVRDTEQIIKRWVKSSDWQVHMASLRRLWGSLGHYLRTRKMHYLSPRKTHQVHANELSTHWKNLGLMILDFPRKPFTKGGPDGPLLLPKTSKQKFIRDFPRERFTKGGPESPLLLLKTLRRELIDWEAVEEMYIPRKICQGLCQCLRSKKDYSAAEWAN